MYLTCVIYLFCPIVPFHRLISSNNKNEPSLDLIEKGWYTVDTQTKIDNSKMSRLKIFWVSNIGLGMRFWVGGFV